MQRLIREITEDLLNRIRQEPESHRRILLRENMWHDLLFGQVSSNIQGTARENARAKFPNLHPEVALRRWTQLKRIFNVYGDPKKLIDGVPHAFSTVHGSRTVVIEEMVYKETARPIREHQDRINNGGRRKSRKLSTIEQDSHLRQRHDAELTEILRPNRRRRRQ